jgi:hypothetical protein
MAKKRPMTWMPKPVRRKRPTIPDALKAQATAKTNELVETVLKSKFIQPPPKKPRFNYVIDVAAKWRGSSLYFVLTYASPGPHALSPTFEAKLARLEYADNQKFDLAFMRHTSEWVTIHNDLSLAECLDAIENDPWFQR